MGYLILFGWLILLPVCVGGLVRNSQSKKSLSVQWLWGQFILWAAFQLTATWFILKEGMLPEVTKVYIVISAFLGAGGILFSFRRWTKVDNSFRKSCYMWIKEQKLLTAIFVLLWMIQIAGLLFLAVNDGDDAFYMAVAERARESGAMYTSNVYSFGYTELNYRYALAPFPIWIAFLSKISGVHTLAIGHVVLGITLVTMSYVIYGEAGQLLFGANKKKQLQLLIFVAVLYIWGNTSSHTAESFLLLRTRQGKALVAGLVFPAMVFLLLTIGKTLEERGKITWQTYLLATAVILTGCLGSTLGGALVILLWAGALFLLAIGYGKWRMLFWGALSAAPGVVYALLYLMH